MTGCEKTLEKKGTVKHFPSGGKEPGLQRGKKLAEMGE